jgi:hypothetical protein
MIGAPILIDGAPTAAGRLSPHLGEHTEEILRETLPRHQWAGAFRIDALRRTRASSAPRVGDPAWFGRPCPPKRDRRDKPGDGNHQKGARASP